MRRGVIVTLAAVVAFGLVAWGAVTLVGGWPKGGDGGSVTPSVPAASGTLQPAETGTAASSPSGGGASGQPEEASPAAKQTRPEPTGANPSIPIAPHKLVLKASADGTATVSYGPIEGPFATQQFSGTWTHEVELVDLDSTMLVTVESSQAASLGCKILVDGTTADSRDAGSSQRVRCSVNNRLGG